MAVAITPCFTLDSSNYFSASVTVNTSGTFQVLINSGSYILGAAATIEGVAYESWIAKYQQTLNNAHTGVWNVDFAPQNPSDLATYYRLSIGCTLGFSASVVTTFAEQLSGIPVGLSRSVSNMLTASRTPYFFIIQTRPERNNFNGLYEPKSPSMGIEMMNGQQFSIRRSGSAQYADWTFPLEPKAKVKIEAATQQVPWTYEHFVKQVRADTPFLTFTGTILNSSGIANAAKEHIWKLRNDSANWNPQPRKSNYHDFWNVTVKAILDEF